jgi:hypothetical protein
MRSEPKPRVLGRVLFVDDATRDVYEVYEDADGRQWAAGYDRSMSNLWLIAADEPLLVGPDITSHQEHRDIHSLLCRAK